MLFNLSENITLEVSAEEAHLLHLAFSLTQTKCEILMLRDEFQGFADRSQNTFDYGFAKAWARKLQPKPRAITLKGKSEFRMFTRLLYASALAVKQGVLEDSPSIAGLQNARREMELIKRVITEIATRGGIQLPPLELLSIPETSRKPYQERNDKYIPFFTFADGSRVYADGLVEKNADRNAPGRLNPDYVERPHERK